MTRRFVLLPSVLLLVLLEVALVASHTEAHARLGDLDPLDDRTREAWNAYRLREGIPEYTGGPVDVPSHRCDHDSFVAKTGLKRYMERQDAWARETAADEPIAARHQPSLAARARGRIRIFFDTDLVTGTEGGYQCYQHPQVITLSDGNSYSCRPEDVVTPAARNFVVHDIIPYIRSTVESFLLVDNLLTPFQIPFTWVGQELCQEGLIAPDRLFEAVADTDLYIVATLRPAGDSSTIATALPCIFKQNVAGLGADQDRPLVGVINFSPRFFQTKPRDPYSFRLLLQVGLHELTHALGFTSSAYDRYRHPTTGAQYAPGTVYTSSGGTPNALITPNVAAYARYHFGCDTLDGFPLEDEGGAGTAGSHWEQRDAGEEYMTGVSMLPMTVSGLTFSLFKDMGWYSVDDSHATDFAWGFKQGCGFLSNACDSPAWPYYCTPPSIVAAQGGCSPNRYSYGVCQPPPETMPVDCTFKRGGFWCQNGSASEHGQLGEFYCDQCRCFNVESVVTTLGSGIPAACYQVNCTFNPTTGVRDLSVQVAGKWKPCPPAQEVTFTVNHIDVVVKCPTLASDICGLSTIDSSRIVPFGGKTYSCWLTDDCFLFWGTIAVIGVLILCIVWTILACVFDCVKCLTCNCCCAASV